MVRRSAFMLCFQTFSLVCIYVLLVLSFFFIFISSIHLYCFSVYVISIPIVCCFFIYLWARCRLCVWTFFSVCDYYLHFFFDDVQLKRRAFQQNAPWQYNAFARRREVINNMASLTKRESATRIVGVQSIHVSEIYSIFIKCLYISESFSVLCCTCFSRRKKIFFLNSSEMLDGFYSSVLPAYGYDMNEMKKTTKKRLNRKKTHQNSYLDTFFVVVVEFFGVANPSNFTSIHHFKQF